MERSADHPSARIATIAGIVLGAAVGGVSGLILAVNLVIYLGPDQGYESSIGDVFEHSTLLGLATVAVVVAGPVIGIMLALRLREQSSRIPES